MAYDPFQPVGQQVMASSQGVVIASNQSPVSVAGTVIVTALQGASVSGQVGSSIIGAVPVTQSTNPWIITGSVQASLTPAANQSVSGTVGASVIGLTPVSVSNFPTTQNVSGSVVGFQGTSPWIITGSVQGSFSAAANQSVSGTVGASIIGNVPVVVQSSVAVAIISGSIAASFTPPANQSVSGAISVSNLPTTQNVSGSVVATQGTSPWIITGSVQGSFSPSGNQSVSGTVGASIIGNVNTTITSIATAGQVMGSVAALQGTNPWIITGSVQASLTPAANQSVSGTVGASIIGQLPAGTATIGSITALQGTNPYIITGSIQGGFSVVGTVPVSQTGQWIPSAIGYATRNDNISSFLGGNLTFTPVASDSSGRYLTKPFAADESRLDAISSTVSTSVAALFASVVGLRNYVTDIFVANTGSVATLITFKDGSTSILGYTIAPAGGGSNIIGMNMPMRTAPAQDFVYQPAIASSVLYITAKGYKAP